MTGLAPTTRPNGKVYVPRRRIRVETWAGYEEEGVLVLGTHDRAVAEAELGRLQWRMERNGHVWAVSTGCTFYGCGRWYCDGRGWFRLVPWSFDTEWQSTWIEDDVRGTPGVRYVWDDSHPCACPDPGRPELTA